MKTKKINQYFLNAIRDGYKPFEIRKDSDFDQKDLEKINTKIKNTKIILDEIKNN